MTKKTDDVTHQSITITHKHMSYCAALLILGFLFTFIAGYYWGKKAASERFVEQCAADALGDKMYASMCSLYDTGDKENTDDESSEKTTQETNDTDDVPPVSTKTSPRYYAKLIGFGSKNSAQTYVDKLAERGIAVNIVERQSKSARGKVQMWYQVVTQPLAKDELMNIVNKLSAADHLVDVAIIELSSEPNERSHS